MNILDSIKNFLNKIRNKQPKLPTGQTASNNSEGKLADRKSMKNDFVSSLHYEVPSQNQILSKQPDNQSNKRRTITKPKASNIKKKFSSVALAALLAASIAPATATLTGCNSSKSHEDTLEYIENSDNVQDTLESLGIEESDYNSLKELASNVNDDNLQESAETLRALKLSIGKSKIANALGVDKSDITFEYKEFKFDLAPDTITAPVVTVANDDGTETIYSEIDGNLSKTIANYILNLDYTTIKSVDGFYTALESFENDFMLKDITLDENNILQANDIVQYIQVTMEDDELDK